jgi:C4-dicarboxylate-specific signal transduction histidine kinase
LGQIAGGMAHEVFSPLAAIQTQLDYAQQYLIPDVPEQAELRDVLDEIGQQKIRIADIVSHLRALAHGDMVSCEQVDLGQVLKKSMDIQQSQFATHGIVVQLDVAPYLPPLWANPLMLEQAFINILLNARDALEAVTGERKIRISVQAHARGGHEWLQARVEDNGPGVSEALRDQIFEPFFTTKGIGHGLGLGLSIARKHIAEYGGTIKLERTPGGGAIFIVELPVGKEASNET